ncbi:putative membrane protein [Lactobacillus colini]|uniref:Membrane protein n=1 Tax=Lactobacillus colini TaxID=1819254 RepID=A0ABS4MHR9_9LACO|nr:hypothetical protein [Lactobacillus colini]MBP2058891.1 putative membrane protein [Lactobacillus colini]
MKKIKLILSIIFSLLLIILFTYLIVMNTIHGKESIARLIKDIVYIIIMFLILQTNIHKLKRLGKYDPEADDERDVLIERQTGSQVLNIIENIILIVGFTSIIGSLFTHNDYLQVTLLAIGVTLLLLFHLSIILRIIITIVNYRKN